MTKILGYMTFRQSFRVADKKGRSIYTSVMVNILIVISCMNSYNVPLIHRMTSSGSFVTILNSFLTNVPADESLVWSMADDRLDSCTFMVDRAAKDARFSLNMCLGRIIYVSFVTWARRRKLEYASSAETWVRMSSTSTTRGRQCKMWVTLSQQLAPRARWYTNFESTKGWGVARQSGEARVNWTIGGCDWPMV